MEPWNSSVEIASTKLTWGKEIVLIQLILNFNWTVVNIYSDTTSEKVDALTTFLGRAENVRFRLSTATESSQFRRLADKGIFAHSANGHLHLVVCTETCVRRILERVLTESSPTFVRESKWLVVTPSVIKGINSSGFENMAVISEKDEHRGCAETDYRLHTLTIDGDNRTFAPIQNIDVYINCLKKEMCASSSVSTDLQTPPFGEDDVFPNSRHGLNGRTVRVGVAEWASLLTKTQDPQNVSRVKYGGFAVDVLNELQKALNFRIEFFEPTGPNVWRVLFGMLTRKVHITINASYIWKNKLEFNVENPVRIASESALVYYNSVIHKECVPFICREYTCRLERKKTILEIQIRQAAVSVTRCLTQEIDVMGVPSIPSVQRQKVMDFTFPVCFDNVRVFYKQPTKSELKWRAILDVISWPVISLILGTLLFTSLVLGGFHIYSRLWAKSHRKGEQRCIELILQRMFNLFGNLLRQGEDGGTNNEETFSVRLVFAAWCVFCLVLTVTVTAYLVPALGVVRQPVLFRTVKDLMENNDYTWGMYGGEEIWYEQYFQETGVQDHRDLFAYMVKFNTTDPQILTQNESVHLHKVFSERYAYVSSDIVVWDFYISNCDVTYIGEKILSMTASFPLSKDSPYTAMFSEKITDFFENGLMKTWADKWFCPKENCNPERTSSDAMSLDYVQSVFFLVLIGLCASGIAVTIELLQFWYRTRCNQDSVVGRRRRREI